MKVINFIAGAGAGKSTVCSGLFYEMKRSGVNVELVHEYAKDLTWDRRYYCLSDQLTILGVQNNMLRRLKGKVDYVVFDSCLLLGEIYMPKKYYENFVSLMVEVFNSYDNDVYFINRSEDPNDYVQEGRNETYERAKEIDQEIKDFLKGHNVSFTEIPYNISPERLMEMVL